MPTVAARGIELGWEETGAGEDALLVHETATGSGPWRPFAEELAAAGMRALLYDRRGWGATEAPDGYLRTTVEEQSEDAAALLEAIARDPAVAVGAGLGAIIALDLALRHPALVSRAVLIEPPILSLVPTATAMLAEDRDSLEESAGEGRAALAELYLSGRLGALAAGVGRTPSEALEAGRDSPVSLVAELGAAPAWAMPVPRLGEASRSVTVIRGADTPPVLAEAAERLAEHLPEAKLSAVDGAGPPHLRSPAETALLARA